MLHYTLIVQNEKDETVAVGRGGSVNEAVDNLNDLLCERIDTFIDSLEEAIREQQALSK